MMVRGEGVSWKSCGNCRISGCGWNCGGDDWEKIPCPFCGGTLSEIREQGGKRLRHCYACHFEFFLEGEK